MIIRPITRTDLPQVMELIEEHACYEKNLFHPEAKMDALKRHLFHPKSPLKCLVAENEGLVMAYATFMRQFSTWDADFYLYLDCLFLREEIRGKGLGSAMMEKIKAHARKEGCQLIQWQTPDFNAGAIKFYKKIGAIPKSKERFFWEVR